MRSGSGKQREAALYIIAAAVIMKTEKAEPFPLLPDLPPFPLPLFRQSL
jgi:hypothetical protein